MARANISKGLIATQNQGGGSKKQGLASLHAHPVNTWYAIQQRASFLLVTKQAKSTYPYT